MKSRFERSVALAALVSLTLLTLPGWSQQPASAAEQSGQATTADMETLREKVRADKKALVSANLDLTEEQAAKFWPIYESYQSDLQKLNKRRVKMIDSYADHYGSMTDAQASKLISEAVSVSQDQAAMQNRYAERLDGVVPAVQAARYLQIENKIRALVDYEVASNIPLVE